MRDSRSLTDLVEYFDPSTPKQIELARKTVCSMAKDANDADILLRMLGIHPKAVEVEYACTTMLKPAAAIIY
jgi:hypothetical protein